MYKVQPDFNEDNSPLVEIIHLDCALWATHLLPIFGEGFIDSDVTCHNSLDSFSSFYVNKFIDHQAFDIIF
ncbi:hypothetical protein SERLA73DRAFT_46464 [Serpula lacrymans var. lacrymans S7.3]|uniref:Uncharacterized protein n=1 Tax=Serpula lacrymans var. lacrymans (strain S7.3) TaxID=936435 RepID=F8PKU2_SERL3|nr:hypothetical protein SERLA73DRAFT_46464 [Serpula lacrymans var. lacrymans S7.3]